MVIRYLNNNAILAFLSISWNDNWERQQEIISRFSEHSYIYVFPGVGYLNNSLFQIIKKVISRFKKRSLQKKNPVNKNIHFVKLYFYLPFHNSSFIRKFNLYIVNLQLFLFNKKLWSKLKSKNVIFYSYYPTDLILDLIHCHKPEVSIADLAHRRKGDPTLPKYVLKFEEELVKLCKLVIADSKITCDDYSALKKIYYIPQGVDCRRFSLNENSIIKSLEKIDKPIIGYIGSLHKYIDYDLLEFAIKDLKNYSFVFVGNILSSNAERLLSYPNVTFTGQVGYNDLSKYLKYFNIGIIPYVVSEFTIGVSPTKLFEYGIMKIPVISTNLPEVAQFPNSVLISKDKFSFLEMIKYILTLDKNSLDSLKNSIYELSYNNSWDRRFEAYLRCLEESITFDS